ncbi:MAG: SusC/RagA family TonB-linked outer membrane protein, partial [Bacteroidota bacterium]
KQVALFSDTPASNKDNIQQPQSVTGTITDEDGNPIPGVNIIIKGTTHGAISDVNGRYTINVDDPGAILIFTFIGMHTQEVQVGSQTEINVILVQDIVGLEEVVAIGYGTVKKKDATGSTASLRAEDFQTKPMTQITEMLAGTVAGFWSNQGTRAKGGSSLEVRGPTSLTAKIDPMIVLDGAVYKGSLADINPNDVKSIDILKDASSAAVFGSKAASGVILITTKKGTSGKPTINFSTKIGISEPAYDRKPIGPEEYQQFRADYYREINPDMEYHYYTNPNDLPSDITIQEWREMSASPLEDNTQEYMSRLNFFDIEKGNYVAGKTTDWYDVVMQKGLRQEYNLSLSGSTDNSNYYWSIGYLDNEGIVIGDEYSTFRTRINADHRVVDWLNVGVNAQFADRDESAVLGNYTGMYANSPYGQVFDEDGNVERLAHGHTFNPLLAYYGTDYLRKINSLFADLHADIDLPLGIKYRISFQPRYEELKNYQFVSTDPKVGGDPGQESTSTRSEYSSIEWMIDHILTWRREMGAHLFDVTLLYNVEENKYYTTTAGNKNFQPNEELSFHGLAFGNNPSVNSYDARSTADGMMGRVNYTLLDKYLITASVRRDGYSAFGVENPRSVFPAVAMAWRLGEEDFFNIDLINRMKLRLSWGVNGNRDIGMYSALARVQSSVWYDGTNPRIGVYNSTLANYGLRWERTESFNLGMDVGLLENRISLNLDVYKMNTTDLLMSRILPKITGFSSIMSNLGELSNRGIELTLNTVNVSKQNFSWKSSLMFSLNRNKIEKLFGDVGEYTLLGDTHTGEVPDYSNGWFPGRAIDVIWNYELLGVWQVDEAEDAAVYNMIPGDFKSVDLDRNDMYEDLNDKQFLGYSKPRYLFGWKNDFSILKGLTASVFIRADLGHLGAYPEALNGGSESNDRRSRNVGPVPYWTPLNPINDYARLRVNTSAYGGGIMIYMPRSFVRVQDLSLSYDLPVLIAQRLQLKELRMFASVRNLVTFTKWPHWDPESGSSPMPRTYMLGLDFTL